MLKEIFTSILLMLRIGEVKRDNIEISDKIKHLLFLVIIEFFFTITLIMAITFIREYIDFIIPKNYIQEKHLTQSFPKAIFLSAMIAPVFEELTFRSWLVPSRIYISIAILSTTYLFSAYNSNSFITYSLLLISTTLIFNLYIRSKMCSQVHNQFKKNKILFIYLSVFSFQASHFFNFNPKPNLLILFLITLPQLSSGILLSYTRLKYGLIYSIILHATNNFIFSSINRI